MSRIGKQPVQIPNGVIVTIAGGMITVKGPKGELKKAMRSEIDAKIEDNKVLFTRKGNDKNARSLHGLYRNLTVNMITGVTKGFEKKLEIIGVGYRAQASGNKINFTLGFSHPVEYKAPQGIEFKMNPEEKNIITITGIDNEVLGEVAAKIRSLRKPEPYKGKGIRYQGEYVPKKAGKTAATTTPGAK